MSEATIERIKAAACIIFLMVFLAALGSSYGQCIDRGGISVRGLFWIECIVRSD